MVATGLLGPIADPEVLEALLEYCDFHSAIAVGRTCKRLKQHADTVLDRWVNVAVLRQDRDWDEEDGEARAIIGYENCSADGGANKTGLLRRGWSNGYSSRVALIETALEGCASYSSDVDVEDQARRILRIRNHVCSSDVDGTEGYEWSVSICHGRLRLSKAARYIARSLKWLNNWAPEWDDSDGDEEETEEEAKELDTLRHYALCLLRKADPESIRFSRVKKDLEHSDYPSGGFDQLIMFTLPGHNGTKIEFHYSSAFQVL